MTAEAQPSRDFTEKTLKLYMELADVLGHSSLETARLYLISTGKEHERQLERLGFVK